MKIFCVGLTTKDSIFYLKKFPGGEGKYLAADFVSCGGGPAATAATTITRLGGSASLWSRVGDDLIGKDIIQELSRYNVNTSNVEILRATPSTNATVIIDESGERMIVSYSDPRLYLSEIAIPEATSRFIKKHDMVLVDTRWASAAAATLRCAKEANIPSVLDGEVSSNQCVRDLAPLATYPVFSAQGLLEFLNHPINQNELHLSDEQLKSLLHQAETQLKRNCYVTYGSRGAFYLKNNHLKNVKSFRVDVVDTLGAGDVFHGTFAYYLLKKYPIEEVLRRSCAAAAIKCTAPGGRGCLPTIAMLNAFMKTAEVLEP
ncbi:hypothetical protein COTS27_00993 [Spirochaetota bacterium]|nr:hypothetical protein COTS27_00993 [Spirochaetota bacterium]